MITPATARRALPFRSSALARPGSQRTLQRSSRLGRDARGAFDEVLRSENTWLAHGLARLSPARGPAYARSGAKRALDLSVTIPFAVLVIALILLLILANRVLSPLRPALFRQDRVWRGRDTLSVTKIRSMVTPSEPGEHEAPATVCTAFGRFIRRYYLDELPQLLLVMTGQISLVGIRVLPRNVYDSLGGSWSSERFDTWQTTYAASRLGLTGAHQVFRRHGKEDIRRYHHDMFYVRHASLGFDLYLLWRTLGSRDKEVPHGPAIQINARQAA